MNVLKSLRARLVYAGMMVVMIGAAAAFASPVEANIRQTGLSALYLGAHQDVKGNITPEKCRVGNGQCVPLQLYNRYFTPQELRELASDLVERHGQKWEVRSPWVAGAVRGSFLSESPTRRGGAPIGALGVPTGTGVGFLASPALVGMFQLRVERVKEALMWLAEDPEQEHVISSDIELLIEDVSTVLKGELLEFSKLGPAQPSGLRKQVDPRIVKDWTTLEVDRLWRQPDGRIWAVPTEVGHARGSLTKAHEACRRFSWQGMKFSVPSPQEWSSAIELGLFEVMRPNGTLTEYWTSADYGRKWSVQHDHSDLIPIPGRTRRVGILSWNDVTGVGTQQIIDQESWSLVYRKENELRMRCISDE